MDIIKLIIFIIILLIINVLLKKRLRQDIDSNKMTINNWRQKHPLKLALLLAPSYFLCFLLTIFVLDYYLIGSIIFSGIMFIVGLCLVITVRLFYYKHYNLMNTELTPINEHTINGFTWLSFSIFIITNFLMVFNH